MRTGLPTKEPLARRFRDCVANAQADSYLNSLSHQCPLRGEVVYVKLCKKVGTV